MEWLRTSEEVEASHSPDQNIPSLSASPHFFHSQDIDTYPCRGIVRGRGGVSLSLSSVVATQRTHASHPKNENEKGKGFYF